MASFAVTIANTVSRMSCCMVPFSKQSCSRVALQLERAGIAGVCASQYLSGSALLALAASLAASALLLFAIAPSIPQSAGFFLFSFGAFFAALYYLPSALAARRISLAESELPFLIREAAICLDIGIPFEKCIARLAKRDYALSPELASAHLEIRSGATVQAALLAIASKSGSVQIKRCLMLLCSIYETGGGSEPLRQVSSELASSQLSWMRLQSGRMSLLSIIFICCSALLPSFFTVFAALSPAIGDSQMPSWAAYLAFLLVFPALNLAALLVVVFQVPQISSQSFAKGEVLDSFLRRSGFPSGSKKFALALACFSLMGATALLLLGFPLLAALCICVAPTAYSAASYLAFRRVSEAEARLPDALYAAASTHRLLSSEKMLSFLSKGGFGLLSEAFEIALRRQRAGEGFAQSMSAATAHCPSPLVGRAFSLLTLSYETGGNMYFTLRESAQDVVSFFTLVRERSSQLAIQRYTILAASALLVPVILGTVVGLAPTLFLASSPDFPGATSFLSVLSIACPAYLAINCLLSCLLVAFSETNPARSALYFAFCAPLSQVLFSLFSNSGAAPPLL